MSCAGRQPPACRVCADVISAIAFFCSAYRRRLAGRRPTLVTCRSTPCGTTRDCMTSRSDRPCTGLGSRVSRLCTAPKIHVRRCRSVCAVAYGCKGVRKSAAEDMVIRDKWSKRKKYTTGLVDGISSSQQSKETMKLLLCICDLLSYSLWNLVFL